MLLPDVISTIGRSPQRSVLHWLEARRRRARGGLPISEAAAKKRAYPELSGRSAPEQRARSRGSETRVDNKCVAVAGADLWRLGEGSTVPPSISCRGLSGGPGDLRGGRETIRGLVFVDV